MPEIPPLPVKDAIESWSIRTHLRRWSDAAQACHSDDLPGSGLA